ncbi:MAG: hypothetical protein V4543_15735 [Bacteroidota bacterium]
MKYYLLYLLLLFSCLYVSGQRLVWEKDYGYRKSETVKAVLRYDTGCYIASGNSEEFGGSDNMSNIYSGACLIKISSTGHVYWTKPLPDTSERNFYGSADAMCRNNEGNLFVAVSVDAHPLFGQTQL